MTVRAIYWGASIPGAAPPGDRASLKLHYPARPEDTDEERNTGLIPVDSSRAPFPVAILMPGINIGPESYGWLARALAQRGVVTVTYTLVAEEMPGYVSLTPGMALSELGPDRYGERPSATAIAPIVDELARLNEQGVLAGCLDLQRIVLGGHSAGGTVALLNARPDWFPGLCAAFSYGAHTGAATALGHPEDSMLAVPAELPLLLMGGTEDGCIANSAGRYGSVSRASRYRGSPTARVERTFDEALADNREDCYLALIEGANHFSMVHPVDDSTGRAFIDLPTTRPDEAIRELVLSLVGDFILAHVCGDDGARSRLDGLTAESCELLARFTRRPGLNGVEPEQ